MIDYDKLKGDLNSSSKRIKHQKYNVFESDTVSEKIKKLSDVEAIAYKEIKNALEQGKDADCFLSKKIDNPKYYDKLILIWNIKHLHLNKEITENGFVKRADYLLMIFIDRNNVYFVDIKSHKTKEFKDINYLNILHRNWEWMFNDNFAKIPRRDCNEADNLTNEELKEITDYNISVPICINGNLYMNLTNGLSGDGTNSDHNDIILNSQKIRK